MNHAVIAGYGPGMGAALARRFASEGYSISLLARGRAALDEAVTAFADQGIIARGFEVDLSQPSVIQCALAEVAAATSDPDVLIYNAARWREAATMALSPQDFAQDLSLAITGALVCAQSVYPAMRARGSGTMLFTGGGLALYPASGVGVASLTAGKTGLRGLVYAMAPELAPDGIHVATVTIAGQVATGTAFDPDMIAGHYWDLHNQPQSAWEIERVYRG
ncbi:NAD(P)-dependent dehydrogenase (short-subunit alcohol dehydrogenase family) [Bosea sp. OAE506]|uniref:SDR family NAD(P)-dependent oxidoreductase n=1 Tax=Bosea sp. OAE506 TaxID=2663870 RepID=UPI00178A2BF2